VLPPITDRKASGRADANKEPKPPAPPAVPPFIAPLSAKLAETKPEAKPPLSGPLTPSSPASFDPNAPTPSAPAKAPTPPKADAAKGAGAELRIAVPPVKLEGPSASPAPAAPATVAPPKPIVTPDPAPPKAVAPMTPPAPTAEAKVAPTGYAPAVPAVASGRAEREARPQPGEPPLAPAPGPVQMYHVHSPETLQDVARRTLGSSERWTDIYKLNPTLEPHASLTVGTTLRLPSDACLQSDEGEPVKPLPALRPRPPTPRAQVLPLTGTFMCSLDDKNRLTLPRALREQLGGGGTVLVSPGPDQCLWLTNPDHLQRLGERLEQSQAREADVRVFKRLYFAQTEKIDVAGDGRVTLTDRLVQFAGLHQELVLVGIDDHFEVWDAARWRQYTQQKSATVRPVSAEAE
jgi:MraZ protein